MRVLALWVFFLGAALGVRQAAGFDLAGVDASKFRVTTFAQGLNFPVGMTSLDDGSLLVAVTNGSSYFGGSTGSILRLEDTNGDGVADVQQSLVSNVPDGSLAGLTSAGDLVVTTGQGRAISIYRMGASPSDPLSYLGGLDVSYPSGWLHPHSSVELRETPGAPGSYELYFQVGSATNFTTTTATASLTSTFGVSASLAGDAVHRIALTDAQGGLQVGSPTQIATGLRNATGLAFHPVTGDLYLGDNGIDGVSDPNEPTSPDEIHVLPADQLGDTVFDFGFPSTYQEYRTGVDVGSTGEAPIVNFQPIPMPGGDEAEGINEMAFTPGMWPEDYDAGIVAGFHGKWSNGGVSNEENAAALVNLNDNSYVHLVENDEPGVGHLDGVHSSIDTLFLSDLSPGGGFGGGNANSGKIYAITSLIEPGDFNEDGQVDAADYTIWRDHRGQSALGIAGDANGDHSVDEADFAVWAAAYGVGVGASETVPEPSSLLVALVSCASACGGLSLRRE